MQQFGQLQGILAIVGFADNLQIPGFFQQPANSLADQVMIVCHNNPYHRDPLQAMIG